MKNAMKKIMGLLLVAVLLVSVVPFQALAADVKGDGTYGYHGFSSIQITDDGGNTLKDSAWCTDGKNPETKTVRDILKNFLPDWEANYTFASASYSNQAVMLDDVLHTNVQDTSVTIILNRVPTYTAYVHYIVEDSGNCLSTIPFARKAGQTLTYSDIAANVPDSYSLTRVSTANGSSAVTGGNPAVIDKADLEFNAYVVTAINGGNNSGNNSGNTGTGNTGNTGTTPTNPDNPQSLTANFYVNNALQTTRPFTTNGTVRYLLEQAGYTVSNYSAITANVAGANKGLDDMISLGQTVNIYMTKNSTTNPNPQYVTAAYYINNTYQKTDTYPSNSTVRTLMENHGYKVSDYSSINATVNNATKGLDDTITVGQAVTINMYTSNSGNSGSGSTTNKFPYKVYLHVYLNNNIGEPDRNINITNTLATDGVVSMSEVKNLIPDYYKAKNSNGIGYDGLYLAKGNWVKDYVTDANKYEKLNDVDVRTGEEYVHINVMITNATAKTSSTADTSNPKTGDAIFMTITVMGLSAAALTGLFFYDKKRKAL